MAKKPAPPAAPARKAAARPPRPAPSPERTAASRRSASRLLWFTVIVALLLPWIFPTMLVLFFAMLPSLVALIVDRSPHKYGALSVSALNFAGTLPYLLKLWSQTQSLESAAGVITNVYNLLVIYGASGFGWLIYLAVPPVVASVYSVVAQRRVLILRGNQRKLIEEWGEGIARPETPPAKT